MILLLFGLASSSSSFSVARFFLFAFLVLPCPLNEAVGVAAWDVGLESEPSCAWIHFVSTPIHSVLFYKKTTFIKPTLLLENTRSSSLTLPFRCLSSTPPRPPATCTPLTHPSNPRTMFPDAAVSSR